MGAVLQQFGSGCWFTAVRVMGKAFSVQLLVHGGLGYGQSLFSVSAALQQFESWAKVF